MAPAPNLQAAAEHVRQTLASSPVWAPALEGATPKAQAATVFPLLDDDIPYTLLEFARGGSVTARFVIDDAGVFLEAEGVKTAAGTLRPLAEPPRARGPSGAPPRLVWKPCDQSTSRLRPFWEFVSGDTTRYLRVDGTEFERLTVTGQG